MDKAHCLRGPDRASHGTGGRGAYTLRLVGALLVVVWQNGRSGRHSPPQAWGRLTFIVEEAAIHQDEPALVPLLDPGAGLRGTWRETDGGAVSWAGEEWRSWEEHGTNFKDVPPLVAARPLASSSNPLETPDAGT